MNRIYSVQEYNYSFSPFLLKSCSRWRARGIFAGFGSDVGMEGCVEDGEGCVGGGEGCVGGGEGDITLPGVVGVGV